jgi:hypothetical protein
VDDKSTKQQVSWWRRRWLKVVGGCVLAGVVGLGVAAEYVLHHAGPIVRKRVIETLSARFNAPVELDSLDISLLRGVEVEGGGLRIPYGAGQRLISVDHFAFRTTIKGLLHQPTNIAFVRVDGMEIHLPPRQERGDLLGKPTADPQHPGTKPKIAFTADEILCTNVKLVIETEKPGKEPLEFEISRLDLHDIGAGRPMLYDAELVNPKPVGNIHALGHFGPWNADDPRASAVDGDYSFDHADLNTIKGLGGILSSTGHYAGQLQRITIDGTTDTPDFSLDISNHPVPLHTKFHAYVDGTDGDTTLDPVEAHLLHSDFTCRGKVELIRGQGHDISLDVVMPRARIEDMLELGVKTNPPLMRGALTMQTKLHIPPGKERVAQKIALAGTFKIAGVDFSNAKWQDKIDGLSMRAQGKPEDAREAGSDKKAEVQSSMTAKFNLAHGTILVDGLDYEIPGAKVLMNGVYTTAGDVFEFKGHVRTEATASQMVTGWKSILLMPVDKFLKKNGAGLELPVSISGTGGDVKFGLAMGGSADETAAQIEAGMKGKAAEKKAGGRVVGDK